MEKIILLIKEKKFLIFILLLAFLLRIWKIDKVPVSLFSDELDVGYQAYSIIKTGKDYFGNPFPLYFHSYSDFRTPVYIYTSIPSVLIFGITPLGVRIPAIFFGVLGVLAMYLFTKSFLKFIKIEGFGNRDFSETCALVSAFVIALSPWHLQYSRAAFESTELLFFLLMGLFFFFEAFKSEKFLILSSLFLGLTVWIYSTAKLFTPIILVILFLLFRKNIFRNFSKKTLAISFIFLIFLLLPSLFNTFMKESGLRFNYISVFSDPSIQGEINFQRILDARYQGGVKRSPLDKVITRIVHNKFIYWSGKIVQNYFEALSTQFLFIKGDLNLRHSPEGIGQFYKIELITLILGAAYFFFLNKNRKMSLFIILWILFGILPSALTRDGGYHATRLILILPHFVFLISFGIIYGFYFLSKKFFSYLRIIYLILFFIFFFSYLHTYYVHNPWYSERWWHAGYKEIVEEVKNLQENYDKIIITNSLEQPYIFFASYYPYSPEIWQKGFEEEFIEGFGDLKHIGKFYFGQVDERGIESLSKTLPEKAIYVAASKEVSGNLSMNPERIPEGLNLIKTIFYPSSEPAFYLFEKKKL